MTYNVFAGTLNLAQLGQNHPPDVSYTADWIVLPFMVVGLLAQGTMCYMRYKTPDPTR